MSQMVTAVCTATYPEMSDKPLRRPDYVLWMAINANVAVTMERVGTGCWVVNATIMAVFGLNLWSGIACLILAAASLVLLNCSEDRMRLVNEATGLPMKKPPPADKREAEGIVV